MLIDEVLVDDDERSLASTILRCQTRGRRRRVVFDAVAGFGPLQRHLDDAEVEQLWIIEPRRVRPA